MSTVSIVKDNKSPQRMLDESLDLLGDLSKVFPQKNERILIKPNFGCHSKITLTGATTDLRMLVALIQKLQNQGYSNIIVGDGGMAGYLKVDILDYLGVLLKALKKKILVFQLLI